MKKTFNKILVTTIISGILTMGSTCYCFANQRVNYDSIIVEPQNNYSQYSTQNAKSKKIKYNYHIKARL